MNPALVPELERLLLETRSFLACPEIDAAGWEAYWTQRTMIFTRVQTLPFPKEGENAVSVVGLIREILQQDKLVLERARTQLNSLRIRISTLAASRRALQGYTPPFPSFLLEYST